MQSQRSTKANVLPLSSRSMRKLVGNDLRRQVSISLGDLEGLVSDYRLVRRLAGIAWSELAANQLSESDYGTERVVSGSPNVKRDLVAILGLPHIIDMRIQIELMSEAFAQRYEESGIKFYTAEDMCRSNVLECLTDAVTLLGQVPALAAMVSALVKSIHLIRADQDDYDVSFSDPRIPFSIFVSVPAQRMHCDALRVAEGVLHEALHLHLTLVERVVRLVRPSSPKYYSPWRDEFRTAKGVLHAIYVFRVVGSFLAAVRSTPTGHTPTDYIEKRRREIVKQVEQVRSFQECCELTDQGRRLVRELLSATE